MTTKNHYYEALTSREAEVTGHSIPNKYSKLAEGGIIGIAIYLVSCVFIAGLSQNPGVFLFMVYTVIGLIVVAIACLPILLVIYMAGKTFGKEDVYGRQPDIEGY